MKTESLGQLVRRAATEGSFIGVHILVQPVNGRWVDLHQELHLSGKRVVVAPRSLALDISRTPIGQLTSVLVCYSCDP